MLCGCRQERPPEETGLVFRTTLNVVKSFNAKPSDKSVSIPGRKLGELGQRQPLACVDIQQRDMRGIDNRRKPTARSYAQRECHRSQRKHLVLPSSSCSRQSPTAAEGCCHDDPRISFASTRKMSSTPSRKCCGCRWLQSVASPSLDRNAPVRQHHYHRLTLGLKRVLTSNWLRFVKLSDNI